MESGEGAKRDCKTTFLSSSCNIGTASRIPAVLCPPSLSCVHQQVLPETGQLEQDHPDPLLWHMIIGYKFTTLEISVPQFANLLIYCAYAFQIIKSSFTSLHGFFIYPTSDHCPMGRHSPFGSRFLQKTKNKLNLGAIVRNPAGLSTINNPHWVVRGRN